MKPEEKLSIEVTDVNSIHVDYMDVFESGQGKVGEDLTAKTAGANYKDLGLIAQEVFDLEKDHALGLD